MKPKAIALVYKTGGDYTSEYVNRLADSLKAYGPVTCLTDSTKPINCRTIPLTHDLPGWWSKIELFKTFKTGRTVYFDLDTVINGDISPLFGLKGPFAMLSDFYKPRQAASGVMVWDGDYSWLWDRFKPSEIGQYNKPSQWGDQGYLSNNLTNITRIQEQCPELVASYKASTLQQRQKAAIVCYHGRPRPHQTGWSA
jgi:hypothetical protein